MLVKLAKRATLSWADYLWPLEFMYYSRSIKLKKEKNDEEKRACRTIEKQIDRFVFHAEIIQLEIRSARECNGH